MAIHPLALVSPKAELGRNVEVGPFCTVDAGVVIGDNCRLGARVSLKAGVTLGAENQIEEGAVLGGLPQHLSAPEEVGTLVVGDRNLIRENVTLHRAMHAGEVTRIGSGCLLMVGAHVAHDCVVSDNVVLTNNVMLAGHVFIGERACLGGGAAVHQHCRIGRVAMVGGMARVTQDIPPFVMIDGGSNLVVGLNRVGLRRAGLDITEIQQIKDAYQIIYRSGLSHEERLAELTERYVDCPAAEFEPFFREGVRGFTRERRTPPGATIRPLRIETGDTDKEVAKPAIKKAG